MLAYFSWALPQITIIRLLRAPDGRRVISKTGGHVCSKYWSDATHPHTLDATPLSRHATLPQVPTYGVHERSEHGGLERVQRTFRTGCVRCSQQLRALSYLLLLVPKCVPRPTPVHTHRAAVGAARALLQVFRSLAAVCSPSIVAFDFGFSDRSFSATLCEKASPGGKHLLRG